MLFRKLTTLLFVLSVIFSGAAFAKDVKVTISLDSIKATKATEKSGDELYFSVTVYPSSGSPVATRVPFFPIHWISGELEKVTNVTLWEGMLKDAEGSQIILSLVEQDLAPWDIDDPLGSVKLSMSNQAGKLQYKWSVPDYHDKTEVAESGDKGAPKYVFKSSSGEYEVAFSVKEKE